MAKATINKMYSIGILPQITKVFHEKWQESWNSYTSNKLFTIKPMLCDLNRKDLVIIKCLPIGHTRVTHSHLLSGDVSPECSVANVVSR